MALEVPGMDQLSIFKIDKSFCFNVNGMRYFCSRPSAAILSEKAAALLDRNPNAKCMHVPVHDARCMFEMLIEAVNGGVVDLTSPDVDADLLLRLICEIGNEGLRQQVLEFIWTRSEITPENVLTRIADKQKDDLDVTPELNFIAKHSSEVILEKSSGGTNVLSTLGPKLVKQLLEDPDFVWDGADEIVTLLLEDPTLCGHLEMIPFALLSSTTMESIVASIHLEDMTDALWKGLCSRLVCATTERDAVTRAGKRLNAKEIPYTGDMYSGIISVLTDRHKGNLHDLGVVTVTSRDLYGPQYLQKYVLDLRSESSCYESSDSEGAWFCLDFGERMVEVSHYWVRTYGNGPGHLKTWVLEGAHDQSTGEWVVLDTVERERSMDRANAVCQRDVDPVKDAFRFIRFRLTGKNHGGYWILNCSGLELFGKLYEP